MRTSNNRKSEKSTPQVELEYTVGVEAVSSYGQIWDNAVRNYGRLFPQFNARQAVASLLGMSYQMLSAIIADERGSEIELAKFALCMKVCQYPQGFDQAKMMAFPESAPRLGRKVQQLKIVGRTANEK